MKEGIHPEYVECQVTCGCGNTFTTRATTEKIAVEICSKCHPFYTGKHKLVDSAGRVERFKRRWAKAQAMQESKEVREKKAEQAVEETQDEQSS